jgi:sulfur-carrier protein
MPATVVLSRALLDLFPHAPASVTIEADTVAALIQALDQRFPGMADRLVDETPAIRRHLNVFVDSDKATLTTSVHATSQVYILTAMSGG